MRKIELLAPARTADIGIEAIRHGADAVYIGGPAFSARAAAANSVDDIARVVDYAHTFGARVYVPLNTILYDHELLEAERTIHQLYNIGADAIIVQDFGVLQLDLPPIALHASTQMDTYTPERVRFLYEAGFNQIVLARELTLGQIAACAAEAKEVPLEVFVHGAVCVSYSGRCFASQYTVGRSANRGDCSQFCRMAFDLVDADGHVVREQKHLLSLHDMNRSNSVEEMLLAGVSSFKIEGRLKDVSYVKNITAHYRRLLDEAISKHSDSVERLSYGHEQYTFTPNPSKSFNRGFSPYFLHGRQEGQEAFDTPKAMGEYVGVVSEVRRKSLVVKGEAQFANGDGLCFKTTEGKLIGFRVNRAEGNELFPAEMPALYRGAVLYRNSDQAFTALMAKPTAKRTLPLHLRLSDTPDGFCLTLTQPDGLSISVSEACPKEQARTPQADNMRKQLAKLGDTDYEAASIALDVADNPFIPSSWLANLRRRGVEALAEARRAHYQQETPRSRGEHAFMPMGQLNYQSNVANHLAERYLLAHGAEHIEPAMEVQPITDRAPLLMTCKHCLRYSHNVCPTHHKRRPTWKEPLSLRLADGRVFPLAFDCKQCVMHVYAAAPQAQP